MGRKYVAILLLQRLPTQGYFQLITVENRGPQFHMDNKLPTNMAWNNMASAFNLFEHVIEHDGST